MSQGLRIACFGSGKILRDSIISICQKGHHTIEYVHLRDKEDVSLVKTLDDFGIPFSYDISINSSDFIKEINSLNVEIGLSINCKQIFKEKLINQFSKGAINLHCGLLPLQRGGGGPCIGIINGHDVGMTIHSIDTSVDTGDILAQKVVELDENENISDFHYKCEKYGPEMVLNTINQIHYNCTNPISQTGRRYYYVPTKCEWDEMINWSEKTELIIKKLRARASGPRSFFIYENQLFYIDCN